MFVLCVLYSKDKSQKPGKSGQRSADKLQRKNQNGIATRYGMDGPGIEFQWVEISCIRQDPPWGPPSLLYNGYRVSFPGVKRSGRGVNHPTPSSAEVKERVELYLYSPSGPSWPVLKRTLRFYQSVCSEEQKTVAQCFCREIMCNMKTW
jgi:hypothetical protein